VSIPRLDELLRYSSAEGRISPRPLALARLRDLLGPGSPEPAILGAWAYSSDTGKRRALERQLRFAAERGLLGEVDAFLRGLGEHEWYRDRYWQHRGLGPSGPSPSGRRRPIPGRSIIGTACPVRLHGAAAAPLASQLDLPL
jgi:hypothetical protein